MNKNLYTYKKYITFLLVASIFGACLHAQTQQTTQRPDALALYNAGRYAEAVAVCEQEIAENASNIESYVVMCWSLVRNGQYLEAENRATAAYDISPYDHRIVEIFGEAKYYLGKNEEALRLFENYVSLVGENGTRIGEVYYFMGEIYIRLEKYNHADIAFSKAVRNEPLYDRWWTRLGYAREMASNYSSALTAYEQALVLNTGQNDARMGRTRVLERL
ncbi:MAG: tetratricopeptide repeat protein [Spirochaetales bacterium]